MQGFLSEIRHQRQLILPQGPDRSLTPDDFTKSIVRPRQYRNRRIGDFFKDLDITEGKSTGIPTITAAMKANGSPAVKYEFDDSYSWFMATVPVHPVFLNDTEKAQNDTINDRKGDRKGDADEDIILTDRQLAILSLINTDDRITTEEIKSHFTESIATINRDIAILKKKSVLIRVDGKKMGYWLITRRIKGL